MAVGINYYIYYTLKPDAAGRLAEGFERLQRALHKAVGVRGRLLQGADDPLGRLEVYDQVLEPLRFESCLATEVARLGLAECVAEGSRRHVERFVACV